MTDDEYKLIKGLKTSIDHLTQVIEDLVLEMRNKEFAGTQEPEQHYASKGKSEAVNRGSNG